jgi:hypothetical protein
MAIEKLENGTNFVVPDYDILGDFEAIKRTQEITDDFLKDNKELRDASHNKAGDYHKLASIPTVVVEKWMREGFNIFDKNVTAKEILTRLRTEDLHAFLTSDKRL